jgi:hypothetical protein
MGIIEKIVVSDEALRGLEQDARRHGRTIAEEAARRIESDRPPVRREELLGRMRAFRASLLPQTTDSLALLREDRDR